MSKELNRVLRLSKARHDIDERLYFARMELAKVCEHKYVECTRVFVDYESMRDSKDYRLLYDGVESESYHCHHCGCIVNDITEDNIVCKIYKRVI